MTMVANYYAQVGVGIDKRSLAQVDGYLKKIEKQLLSFQKKTGRSKTAQLNLQVNSATLGASIQRAVNVASRTSVLNLTRITVSSAQLTKAINAAISGTSGRGIRMGALLSQASLAGMRAQVRNSLSNITVSPRINPRVNNPSRGSYGNGSNSQLENRSPNRTSPWHNPMMIGGGAGAFLRYGMFSLPFVGGAMGLNALSEKSAELQSQRTAMSMVAGSSMGADGIMRDGDYYQNYLNGVGSRLGKTTSSMSPFFAQMLAGAKGTSLEQDLEPGFESLMQYSSVMGLGDESLKGAIKAFSQMIGKNQIMAEELRGQAAEHLPSVVRLMADVAAGGDTKKLNKMMEAGELNPAKYLPLLWEKMRQESDPLLGQYQQGQRFKSGETKRLSEEWLKSFLAGGGESGITSVFDSFATAIKSSLPYAEGIGDAFGRAADFAAALILVPKEYSEWWSGTGRDDNFMTALFGKSSGSELVTAIKDVMTQIESIIGSSMSNGLVSIQATRKELEAIAKILTPLVQAIANVVELAPAIKSGDINKIMNTQNIQTNRSKARAQVAAESASGLAMTGMPMTEEQKKIREMEIFGRLNGADVQAPIQSTYLNNVAEKAKANNFESRSWLVNKIMGWGNSGPVQPPSFIPPVGVTGLLGNSAPMSSNSGQTMNIVMSGNVSVSGNVDAKVDSATFGESITNAFATFFTGQMQQAVPQVGNIPQ